VDLVGFLKLSDGKFPKLGFSHRPEDVSGDTATQEQEDQANEKHSFQGAHATTIDALLLCRAI
jgi:hypothetical protein